ncbi:Arm DNA-binding domain-containing protein, partial [uncultured Succinatimonas sp.]|uniref:Arm DNA-binding domain-containing protein n=1 Tax=uncultured Succinatimonas sp. TaxID=1262973 RepID=UPI0025E892CC
MATFVKEKNGTWRVVFVYQDWTGDRKRTTKRGFLTKREAKDWLDDFCLVKADDLNMSFSSLVDAYFEDMAHRLKLNTIMTKRQIVTTKILPYFKDRAVCDISAVDIRKWQAVMIAEGNSETYLRTINNQLSGSFIEKDPAICNKGSVDIFLGSFN